MSSADDGAILGEVRPFNLNGPRDDSVYVYPHRYRIDGRKTHMGYEQRHVWFWNDGREQVEEWIPTPFPPPSTRQSSSDTGETR